MQSTPTGHPTALLPSFVLDALEQDERDAVAHHLAQCTTCRLAAHALATELFDSQGPRPRPWVKWLLLWRIGAQPRLE